MRQPALQKFRQYFRGTIAVVPTPKTTRTLSTSRVFSQRWRQRRTACGDKPTEPYHWTCNQICHCQRHTTWTMTHHQSLLRSHSEPPCPLSQRNNFDRQQPATAGTTASDSCQLQTSKPAHCRPVSDEDWGSTHTETDGSVRMEETQSTTTISIH